MNIYYHKCSKPNIGDDLNLWFWNKILGKKFTDFNEPETMFAGIGTILNDKLPNSKKTYILGSGAGYGNKIIKKPDNWDVYFVRGPLTARAIDVPTELAISDPVIILPDIKKIIKDDDTKYSFMPHVGIDSHILKNFIDDIGINYISPSDDQDEILKKIVNSKALITSAMHGSIIADAYRIPWVPVVTSNEILSFKWKDWCESINVDYNPVVLPAIWGVGENGFFNSIKLNIKKQIFNSKISRILKAEYFILSDDEKMSENKEKIYNKLTLFKKKVLEEEGGIR